MSGPVQSDLSSRFWSRWKDFSPRKFPNGVLKLTLISKDSTEILYASHYETLSIKNFAQLPL
jgi:hypothetical protein